MNGEAPGRDDMDTIKEDPTDTPVSSSKKPDIVDSDNNVEFPDGMLPPPSYDEAMREEQPERQAITGFPKLETDEAREALLAHVAEHCCYGKAAAQELYFQDLQQSAAFHYTLETFGESRSTCWAHEAYKDQQIDGPENGPAPLPWEIHAQPKALFEDEKTDVEVPHTASIKPCHICSATGITTCISCSGSGEVTCSFCSGLGWQSAMEGDETQKSCSFCNGSGRSSCSSCLGTGSDICSACNGLKNLKCFIKLTIVWTKHKKDHIVERTGLPVKLIKKVSGQVIFEEQQPMVWPINHFPDPEVNSASQNIIKEQSVDFPNERILMQKHSVKMIPVTKVLYKWKSKDLDYIVYGFEKKVYAPSYPQKYFCGCSIL